MRRDDELLSAYVDGVSELTTEERRRVEELLAKEPALRVAEQETRGVLEQLRSLSPDGTEPDWAAMERAIHAEVGDHVPRSWWHAAWRWLVPATALALAAGVFALWIRDPAPAVPVEDPVVRSPHDAGKVEDFAVEDPTMALWLDGEKVEIELATGEGLEVDDLLLGEGNHLSPGLLPVDNLAWIDELDVDEIDLAEAWLGRKKG